MKQNTPAPDAASDNLPTRKNRIKYLVLAAFWIAVVLLGFEIYLRFFVSGLKPGVVFDPVWGGHYVAGSVMLWRTEGNGLSHYIADGEIATPYQGGANIPVIGDSHTEALQVNDTQSFVSVAETRLREKGLMVDLRNLGSSGGTLADYTYWAAPVQSRYQPSIVVIQISLQDLKGTDGGEGYFVSSAGNEFAKNTDGTLRLVHQPVTANYGMLRLIRGKLALLDYGLDRYLRFLRVANKAQAADSSDLDFAQKQANYYAQLSALHTAYQGQRVILLVLPDSPIISEGQVVLEDNDYAFLLDQVKRFEDWGVVDPLPAFQAFWLQEHKLPCGFTNSVPGVGHLNADGHALVGQLLADKIAAEMLR